MIRFCPNCRTERPLTEVLCDGDADGEACGWLLSDLPALPEGWRPEAPAAEAGDEQPAIGPRCPNGHSVGAGDLLCTECGADIDVVVSGDADQAPATGGNLHAETDAATEPLPDTAAEITVIAGWRTVAHLATTSSVRERYTVERDGCAAVLTLYADGSEPDPDIYEVLRTIDRDHVPEILEAGRWSDRAYEVREDLNGGTLADLGLLADDLTTLSRILSEVGGALHALGEAGMRHRDLRPGAILVRDRNPLDLVIAGFGSARLSDHDLDVVSPLEITRYTAPEAVAGGVAAASDWWSLGMLLLEQVTRGDCFAGADDQTFLINVLTNGAPIPDDLPSAVDTLLRGLLALDRRARWSWREVQRWLAGDMPNASERLGSAEEGGGRRRIELGGQEVNGPERYALRAAEAAHWDEAAAALAGGELATWLEEAGQHPDLRAEVRSIAALHDVSPDLRLALVLKALNPSMPLVIRGEILTPGWLLAHPQDGYDLITGPVPDRLERDDDELWLATLKRREARVRDRARRLEVELDEPQFKVATLATSQSRLAAGWLDRRRVLPDTDHPGLLALMERRVDNEEDLILLLSASVAQFRAADALVDEAAAEAARAGVNDFDRPTALELVQRPRSEVNTLVEARIEGFARCGREAVDGWADRFRLERRLPLARSLVLLAVPTEDWRQPPGQAFVATLLDFYARRITSSLLRGPLTRMVIGKTTARIDLTALDGARRSAPEILDHLLMRNEQTVAVDPMALTTDPALERRVRTLHSQATLYRRDTGIDGLYLGFPFLLLQEAKATTRPRIAPILLWPARLHPEVGARGQVTLAFDRDREEVRLNPALETLLGRDAADRWQEVADQMLGRASVTAAEVVEAFRELAAVDGRTLEPLPSKDVRVSPGDDRIVCSAVLFHLAFLGQAVMEDLRALKGVPPTGTSLETAFRTGEPAERGPLPQVPERERFFTADSDPSQEAAVLEARAGRGLLVEGPPGTGKSQTIVNLVGDAIGTGRSLLVVCQKQAALEVVHKRLEAAGLGERIVIVNDVNKDRERVIRSVREQLDVLFQRPGGASGWKQRRGQTGARIEALQADLDGQHGALHADDDQTGLSYRLILGDLIALAQEGDTPALPSLRHALGPLDPGSVAGLQEACAPVARLWLPAHWEDSPLAATRAFGTDTGSAETFTADLLAFQEVEHGRAAVIERTPDALAIDDPGPYRSWAADHGLALRRLADDDRQRLARWLTLFTDANDREPDADAPQRRLAELETALLAMPADDAPAGAVETSLGLDDDELAGWSDTVDRLLARPTVLERLAPSRWTAAWRLRGLMAEHGLESRTNLGAALHRERRLRPIRQELVDTIAALGEATGQLLPMRVNELLSEARRIQTLVGTAGAAAARLAAYPEPATAYAMARAATRKAVEDLIEGIDQGLARCTARGRSGDALTRLGSWMEDDWLRASREAIVANTDRLHAVDAIAAELPHLAAYQRFRARVGQLGEQPMAVFRELARLRSPLEALDVDALEATVRRVIATEARLGWKTRLENAQPALLFEAGELDAKCRALAEADREMRDLNRRLLVGNVTTAHIRPEREWEDITRLRGVRARRLREFVERGADMGLMHLRPVWLVNPDVASRLLPLRPGLFDTVIFDEASQMPVEYALPTLFRSGRMVVSGDEKQMPPSAFFSGRTGSDEDELFEGQDADISLSEDERDELQETWNRREIKDCPDLLQLAKTVLPSTTLQIHYRSVYRELIGFSNASFYANRLSVPARHPADEIRRKRPVELIRVDGTYEDQTNPDEASRVVDVLSELWRKHPVDPPTVGVVTFNRKQADLIEEVLEERAEADRELRAALTRERDRTVRGEDMSVFVKNVENVQGDERDVMVFSSTFGRNAQGTFRRAFGVLGQIGGERRLNVAVTRAKTKVVLVTSMPIHLISDLLTTRRQAVTPRDYLQAYFEYARLISDGDLDAAEQLLTRLTPEGRQARCSQISADDEDGLQRVVADEVRALGWRPISVADDGAFGLDFAIEDPRTGLFGLGIECDAPRHPLLANARARELWRPGVLRRSIPSIHRVSSHRWYHEPDVERERLRAAVATAMGQAA